MLGKTFLSRFCPSCIKCGLFAVRKKCLLQFSQLLFTPLCLNLPTLHISPNFPSQRPTLGRRGWLKVKNSWLFSSIRVTPLLSHSTHGALLSLWNASGFTWVVGLCCCLRRHFCPGCAVAVQEGIHRRSRKIKERAKWPFGLDGWLAFDRLLLPFGFCNWTAEIWQLPTFS